MTSGWVGSMKLMILIAAPHVEHRSGSTCQTRLRLVLEQLDHGRCETSSQVEDEIIALADSSGEYQSPWRHVIQSLLDEREDDYDFLEM